MRILLPSLFRFFTLLVLAGIAANGAHASDADIRARYYNELLKAPEPSMALDQTIGIKIAGTRNVKTVLAGALYRGGGPGGQTAMGDSALRGLCEKGFSKALYLYTEGFKGPRSVACTGPDGKPNSIRYETAGFVGLGDKREALSQVKSVIEDASKGPIFVHCWNGYHASGEIAAVALMQFCGYGVSAAQKYWMRNQRGAQMISRIAKFSEIPELRITSDLETAICPR